MTLVWMCFENDVTCLQRYIARRTTPATSTQADAVGEIPDLLQQCDQRSVAGRGRALSQGDAPLRKKQIA